MLIVQDAELKRRDNQIIFVGCEDRRMRGSNENIFNDRS